MVDHFGICCDMHQLAKYIQINMQPLNNVCTNYDLKVHIAML